MYLDEKDNRTEQLKTLRPNGFTEETVIDDFPVRNRKFILHVRRRRWLDAVVLNYFVNRSTNASAFLFISVFFSVFGKMVVILRPEKTDGL